MPDPVPTPHAPCDELARLREENERLRDLLGWFVKAAYPVAESINPRGHNWSEAYLDSALAEARAALEGK